MHGRHLVVYVVLGVVIADVGLVALSNSPLGHFGGAIAVLAACILIGISVIWSNVIQSRTLRSREVTLGGKTYRADADVESVIQQAVRELSTEISRATLANEDQINNLRTTLDSIHSEWAVLRKLDLISQRNQAVVTTLIGLIGGFLGSLLITGIHLP